MLSYTSVLTAVFDRKEDAPLTIDEERAAILAAQSGDNDAKLRLVLAYGPALRSGLAQYVRAVGATPHRFEPEDARQEVVLGLLEAVENFDLATYDRLAQTAPGYIHKAVGRLAPNTSQFTIPERTLTRFFGILRKAAGDADAAELLAPENAMTADTFRTILAAVRRVDSLDGIIGEGGTDFAPLSSPLDDVEDRVLVESAFSAIDGLEEEVVRLAYGFADFDPLGDEEVGERLGFSRAKSQRTRSSALGKMREALGVA